MGHMEDRGAIYGAKERFMGLDHRVNHGRHKEVAAMGVTMHLVHDKTPKPVMMYDKTTGTTLKYDSLTACENAIGTDSRVITSCIRGGRWFRRRYRFWFPDGEKPEIG